MPLVVMTIGHSTRTAEEFVRLLKAHGVERLVDVRTVPRSRHNPQFNRDQLSPAMHRARLHYRYMPGLGGFRHARRDSTNTGWHNSSFRGFADYMQTPEFRNNLDDLIELAKQERIAVMCAEAVPWCCQPDPVAWPSNADSPAQRVRWHRAGFQLYWRVISPARQPLGRSEVRPVEGAVLAPEDDCEVRRQGTLWNTRCHLHPRLGSLSDICRRWLLP